MEKHEETFERLTASLDEIERQIIQIRADVAALHAEIDGIERTMAEIGVLPEEG